MAGDNSLSWYVNHMPTCHAVFRPSRKGGHRHNHCSNRWILGYYKSKRLRKGLRRCRAAFLTSFIKSFARRHGGI